MASEQTVTKDIVKQAEVEAISGEDLVAENLSALTAVVAGLGETIEMLTRKTENMACHLVATEEILAEVVAITGVDLACVNARIRARILNGTDGLGSPDRTIDAAAAIASPVARFM